MQSAIVVTVCREYSSTDGSRNASWRQRIRQTTAWRSHWDDGIGAKTIQRLGIADWSSVCVADLSWSPVTTESPSSAQVYSYPWPTEYSRSAENNSQRTRGRRWGSEQEWKVLVVQWSRRSSAGVLCTNGATDLAPVTTAHRLASLVTFNRWIVVVVVFKFFVVFFVTNDVPVFSVVSFHIHMRGNSFMQRQTIIWGTVVIC